MKLHEVTLLPSGRVIQMKEGETLLAAAKRHGILVKSTCGGVASCRTCVVKIIDGEQNISEQTFEETQLIGNVFHITRERLSCQLWCQGPLTVDITDHLDATVEDMGSKTLK